MNRHDPQLGIFIRKHASAAALFCDVWLICVVGDADQKKNLEWEEKEEHRIRTLVVYFRKLNSPVPLVARFINLFRYAKATRAGLNHIEKNFGRHDVTHAYIMLRPAIMAWWIKFRRGIPFVISEQWSGYATGKFQQKNFLTKFFYRKIFAAADAVTSVSSFLETKMEMAGLKNNYTITPNVVEPMAENDSPLPLNNSVKILTVADLVDDIKNISGTLRAIAAIAATNKNIQFHIIGHGRDEGTLKNLARELNLLDSIVFFHGVKTNEEVFQYLHACDFLIMNSRFETFSLVCIEAMSCGKPVVATRSGGPDEFINDQNGILVEPDKPQELIDAIQKMISDHKNYRTEALKEYVLENFGAEKTGKKFHDLYLSVLDH